MRDTKKRTQYRAILFMPDTHAQPVLTFASSVCESHEKAWQAMHAYVIQAFPLNQKERIEVLSHVVIVEV
jgi:hypothetical protein